MSSLLLGLSIAFNVFCQFSDVYHPHCSARSLNQYDYDKCIKDLNHNTIKGILSELDAVWEKSRQEEEIRKSEEKQRQRREKAMRRQKQKEKDRLEKEEMEYIQKNIDSMFH